MRPSGNPRAGGAAFRPKKDPLLDSEVLDDATRRALMANLGRDRPPAPKVRAVSTDTTGDGSVEHVEQARPAEDGLSIAILSRLNQLETQVSVLQKELREKNMQNVSLQDHLNDYKDRLSRSEHEKLVLAERLSEMNHFFADHNLTFVGQQREGSCSTSPGVSGRVSPSARPSGKFDLFAGEYNPAAAAQPPAPAAKPPQEPAVDAKTKDAAHAKLPFDLELARHQAERLSCAIANMTVQTNGKTGIIKERDTVYVCVYSDGICVNSGVFRPYGWPICDAFLTDLLEGYYPYEYRDRYPSGFLIEIIDKAALPCPKDSRPLQVNLVNDHGYKPLDRDGLLNRLPQQYITAAGKLVDVKSAVADFIGERGASLAAPPLEPQRIVAATAAETEAAAAARQAAARAAALESPVKTSRPITTIRVKFAQGHDVTVRMYHEDSIRDLRAELLKASAAFFSDKTAFELCSVYPRRTYADHSETLAAAGLVPSAALQIKLVT